VHVRGYVDESEKWRWFATADVFISMSAYEGMPVATLEALSSGVPVILSSIPAHRAIIERHDSSGTVVEGTVQSVEDAIEQLAGTTATVSLPSWNDVAESYLRLVAQTYEH